MPGPDRARACRHRPRSGREARDARGGCRDRQGRRGGHRRGPGGGRPRRGRRARCCRTGKPSLTVGEVVETLHEIAAGEGSGSQGRKLDLLAGLLPGPPRWRPATCCAWSPGACGSGSARRRSSRRSARCTPAGKATGRCWSGRTTSAATSAWSPRRWSRAGWTRSRRCRCGRATRCGSCSPSGCLRPSRSWRSWAASARPSTSTTGCGCRRTAPPTADRAVHPPAGAGQHAVPRRRRSLAAGLGPQEAIVEGEVVAYDAAAGELRPFQEVMFRRRKYGIAEAVRDVPVGLFCFELLYADGEDLTRLPVPAAPGAAGRRAHSVRPAAADHGGRARPPGRARRRVRAAVAEGWEGLVCKSVGRGLRLPGRRPRLAVDQAEAGLPDRAGRHHRPGRGRGVRRAGPPPRGVRGGAAGRVRPGRRPIPDRRQVRHRLLRRRAGRAARPAGAVPARRNPPGSTRGSRPTCGSSPGWCWRCSAPS